MTLLVFLPVKQDPVVGGKPPRSPILSRRSYLSPVRGRRVGGMSSLNQALTSIEIAIAFMITTYYIVALYITSCCFSRAV